MLDEEVFSAGAFFGAKIVESLAQQKRKIYWFQWEWMFAEGHCAGLYMYNILYPIHCIFVVGTILARNFSYVFHMVKPPGKKN